MTVEEAFEITGLTSNGEINSPDWIKATNYWLGSADNADNVWRVNGEVSFLGRNYFIYDDIYGVRPVIEISKSLI